MTDLAPPVISCRRCKINVPAAEMAVRLDRSCVIARGKCLMCGHESTGILPLPEAEEVRILDIAFAATVQQGGLR